MKRERRILTVVAIPLGMLLAAAVTLILMSGYWSWRDNLLYAMIISLMTYLVVLVATRTPLKLVGSVSAIQAIRTTAYMEQQGRSVSRQMHWHLTMQRLAWMNFTRSRKKAMVTALSLSLTGILLICVAAYANSVDAEEIALASFGDGSNYLLMQHEDAFGQAFVETQAENPLGKDLQERLADLPNVDYITAYSSTSMVIPKIMEDEPFDILGLTREQMSGMYVGDAVTLRCYNGQSKTYTVMGIVEEARVGSGQFFILPEEELHGLYPEIADFTAYLNIHVGQDGDGLRRAVCDTVTDTRINVVALGDMVSQMEASLQGELAMFYGILTFIFVFSLINLINTLITNLLSRQQEFGIFQFVGMSSRQFSKMLSLECLIYAGTALLATLTVGTVCSAIICRVFDQLGIFGKITYHFPVLEMLLFAAALLLVQGVFSAGAACYSRKFSLVERIKSAD